MIDQSNIMNEIRVRMAPSPTGYLHIGTARTSIFNWLFARHHKGAFILRIEDTDDVRSESKFEEDIIEGLAWLGIDWDEFYRQTDRLKIYTKYINQLLDTGKAFWCYHTLDELEEERRQQTLSQQLLRHVCVFKDLKKYGKKAEKSYKSGVIRLAVAEDIDRIIAFNDTIRGRVEFHQNTLGDFSIARDDQHPLYNLAVVIDDYEMNITHIIRGEDHIANTPKQILIQEALGFDMLHYAHVPMILAPDRSKLSKRHGATSLHEYRTMGYIAESLFNYLAFLGFTPPAGSEILSKNEIIDIFELNNVHKSGAIFDIKKLEWVSGEYIKRMDDKGLAKLVFDKLTELVGGVDKDYLAIVIPLMRDRLRKSGDVVHFLYFFQEPVYKKELLIWKDRSHEEVAESLQKTLDIVRKNDVRDKESLRNLFNDLGRVLNDRGLVYWPFRVALSGQEASPDPIDIASVLGQNKTIQRLEQAINILSQKI